MSAITVKTPAGVIEVEKLESIVRAVTNGASVSEAAGGADITPHDLDLFLVMPQGKEWRSKLAIAAEKANASDLVALEADSEAFGWQAAMARIKKRREDQDRHAVSELNAICMESLFG